jgi:hypothetical protein
MTRQSWKPLLLMVVNTFNIYFKIDNRQFVIDVLMQKNYPPKVRYTVDVRPFLKNMLRELTDIFSEQKLSFRLSGIT